MDNKTFKTKCKGWLRDVETVSNVQWILSKSREPDSVTVIARIRKKIIDGNFTLSQSFFVSSTTCDEESTIQTAVLATNEKVVELVQEDSALWKSN